MELEQISLDTSFVCIRRRVLRDTSGALSRENA
jgi:hypothetical protein